MIRLLSEQQDAQHLLLLEEQRQRVSPTSLMTLGLTRRQAEILFWVIQGKTNPEIATILGVSTLTVRTHLERVFAKLKVETRTAAVRQALEILGVFGDT